MFVLMTVYWILFVVFTFLQIDSWDNIVTVCYGSDNALLCLLDATLMPTTAWLGMFVDILFVDVSTV
jgi:hypothetical protein